ncbi:Lpg1974 family pore-forming outer membrane protein [Lacipirellula parvula]|uniref:Protochlamydia outer membrane protein domain-containing protein n=1 Tax=Lacipirellula parvula TaxID=2650471 RepID=A0A5K7XHH3_9BACT|nr:Lpg1974 family pore-forming outer membrane protein [Lacipirellula parvula]BBO36330.1 hypothetical protein PLANPX_5942 [Lacipirellula parvula]
MRRIILLLTLSWQLLCHNASAHALEFFGDFLYWKATETVDWTLDQNSNPANQFVAYRTIEYGFDPGFRAGVAHEGDLDARFYYTRFHTSTSDSATGQLTGAFMGAKMNQPPAPTSYFDVGQVAAEIDYNMFDFDLGRRFQPSESLMLRPVVGLRAGWINQNIDSQFDANYLDNGAPLHRQVNEAMTNDFWGIGPKLGLENALNLHRGEACEFNLAANFYAAYLIGHWDVDDVTRIANTQNGSTTNSNYVVDVDSRDFGALAFQAILGLNMKYGRWTGTVGYELNDWLNQGQFFDDATGPHDNDLLLQGLTARLGCSF